MNGQSGASRIVRWLMLIGMTGLLPAFVMRCDKAALNFQKGLTQGLGGQVSEILADRALDWQDEDQNDNDND